MRPVGATSLPQYRKGPCKSCMKEAALNSLMRLQSHMTCLGSKIALVRSKVHEVSTDLFEHFL